MNVQKPRAGILLEVDLSVRPESYYYYYSTALYSRHFSTTTPLHYIAPPLLHCTSLFGEVQQQHTSPSLDGGVLYNALYFAELHSTTLSARTGSALAWHSEVAGSRLTQCSKSCNLQPALQCAIRGAQGILPCVGWGVRPVNWIYRL